jgi:hypothetical protein
VFEKKRHRAARSFSEHEQVVTLPLERGPDVEVKLKP